MLGNSAEVGIHVFQTAAETIRILFFSYVSVLGVHDMEYRLITPIK